MLTTHHHERCVEHPLPVSDDVECDEGEPEVCKEGCDEEGQGDGLEAAAEAVHAEPDQGDAARLAGHGHEGDAADVGVGDAKVLELDGHHRLEAVLRSGHGEGQHHKPQLWFLAKVLPAPEEV